MLLVKIGLLLLAFYGSLFHSWIHLCIFSLSSLAYFSSDADPIAQLSCSCHTCAWNKVVLKGEFCFGVYCEQHCSLLVKPTKGHKTKGLSWDSADAVYPRAVSGFFSLLQSMKCDIVVISVHLKLVFIESNYRLRLLTVLFQVRCWWLQILTLARIHPYSWCPCSWCQREIMWQCLQKIVLL